MVPTITRNTADSSSFYSSSRSQLSKIKKFDCKFAGCGKSYIRSEHLHRHALNHKDSNDTCPRCRACFFRRDLLERHMERHKAKDDEAGGVLLGTLATKKRLWRDDNGNIIRGKRAPWTKLPKRTTRSPSCAVERPPKTRDSPARRVPAGRFKPRESFWLQSGHPSLCISKSSADSLLEECSERDAPCEDEFLGSPGGRDEIEKHFASRTC